jgi:tetratricopeptide (TPR) repeat protein
MTRDAESNFQRAFDLSNARTGKDVALDSIRGLVRTSYALQKPLVSDSWFTMLVNKGAATGWDWQEQGTRLYAQNKYVEAGNAYRNAASTNGGWANWCRAANSFWFIKDDDALASARECISAGTGEKNSEPALSVAHRIIAGVLNSRGVYAEALTHAREAVNLDATEAWNFSEEADALFGLRRFQEAINTSNQAIRLSDGKYAHMHFRLGNSYFELENWEFARQSFEKASELDPTDDAAPYNAALCFQNLGYRHDAAKWFREVLRRNPHHPDRPSIERKITQLTGDAP